MTTKEVFEKGDKVFYLKEERYFNLNGIIHPSYTVASGVVISNSNGYVIRDCEDPELISVSLAFTSEEEAKKVATKIYESYFSRQRGMGIITVKYL